MPTEIVEINGLKRIVQSNSEPRRKLLIGNNWNIIRLGILCCIHASANIAGTPRLAFGMCSDGKGYSDTSGDNNVIGARWNQATVPWLSNSGNSYLNTGSGSYSVVGFKKVDGTFTNSSTLAGSLWGVTARADLARRTALFVEIEKGSPNFTLRNGGPDNATGMSSNVTEDEFLQMMETASLGDHGSIVSGYRASAVTGQTLAFSEADGDLDHFFMYWNRSSPVLSVDKVAYRRIN